MLFSLFSYITGGERRQKAKALAAGEDPDGDAQTLDVLAIQKFAGARPDPEAFVEALDPLQPRLYSIASSPRIDGKRIALCVDAVPTRSRNARGSASPPLSRRPRARRRQGQDLCPEGAALRPATDPSLPIIMIGPGTGIAPFRAFLYERMASKAPGATGCSSATSAATTTSSTRTSLPA